jgi:hypothetical protein
MTKAELTTKTNAAVNETKTALQTVYDALNQGQQKKLLRDEAVATLFERYGVEV